MGIHSSNLILMTRDSIAVFNKNWKSYDLWFSEHPKIYTSELKALKKFLPSGMGLEIGVGTGRFASKLSVAVGLDPSYNMLHLAQERVQNVVQGVGEYLPFKNETFHFVLIVVTLCFASNPQRILAEAKRVLKKSGELILAIIDRNSSWGKYYSARAGQSAFYRTARFLTPEEVLPSFSALGMEYAGAYQTLIQPPPVIHRVENPQKGYGTGGFVVFKAKNSARR